MRLHRLFPTSGTALLGTVLTLSASQAAPVPASAGHSVPASGVVLAGDQAAAAVAGALLGGAVGAMLGSSVRAHAAPPPVIVEEEEPVVIRRPARRVVEVEEDDGSQVIEDCVTRRTKVYDPELDETIVRKERRCR